MNNHRPTYLRFVWLLAVIFLTPAADAQNPGTSFQEAKKNLKATWHCYYTTEAAFFGLDSNGKPQGICVEIIRSFSDYIKDKYRIDVSMEFEELRGNTASNFNKVKRGNEGDFGLAFAYVTDKRKKDYNLTRPFFSDVTFLVTNNAISEIRTETDAAKINGFNAYCLKDSFIEQQFKQLESKFHLKFSYNYLQSPDMTVEKIRQLLEKDPKCIIYVQPTDLISISKGAIKPQTHKIFQLTLANSLILSDKNDWTKEFDSFLASYLKDETYKRMLVKYLGLTAYKTLVF